MVHNASAWALFEDPASGKCKQPLRITMVEYTLNGIMAWLARTCQPHPSMTHVEFVFLVDRGDNNIHASHYATYAGLDERANWRQYDETYYAQTLWHAVPLAIGIDSVQQLIDKCEASRQAPYSFLRYLVSTRLFGIITAMLPDGAKSPAHCGGLSARVLRAFDPSLIPEPPPRYGPAYLYNHLLSCYADALSININGANSFLLHKSDAELQQAGLSECMCELHKQSHIHTLADTRRLGRMVQRMILLANVGDASNSAV